KQPAVDLTGLNLKELVALISRCAVFIGNDSGPMHIAAAFARPLIAIFGSSDPAVWSPWTRGPKRVLVAPDISQDSHGAAIRSISRISTEEVISAVDEVMLARTASRME